MRQKQEWSLLVSQTAQGCLNSNFVLMVYWKEDEGVLKMGTKHKPCLKGMAIQVGGARKGYFV